MAAKTDSSNKHERVLAEQRAYISQRTSGYREQALKLYPWICGRCAREFSRTNLRELEVHHIDHNHDNNPSDGHNWELLCMYCHDQEHTKYVSDYEHNGTSDRPTTVARHNPFVGLKEKMQKED